MGKMKNVKAIILEVKDLNSNILGPKYIFDVKLSDFKHTQEIQEADIILFVDEDGEKTHQMFISSLNLGNRVIQWYMLVQSPISS